MSAEEYAETMELLEAFGYGQLAPLADQAREDVEQERVQKLFCWIVGIVGASFALYGLGDAFHKWVAVWKREKNSAWNERDGMATLPSTKSND